MIRKSLARARAAHGRPPMLLLLLGAFLWGTLAMPPSAAAQSRRFDGQVIQRVEYIGLRGLPAETMDYYLFGGRGEERGQLDLEELNRRIKTLWDRELIDDIQIEAEQVAGGVSLTINVVERPILMSINYVGLKRISRSDINEQIDRERIAVYENQPLSRAEMQRLKEGIEELYKEKGFRFAEVSYVVEEVNPGQFRATFTIDEGNKVKIGDIQFDGNTIFGDWRLRRTMKKTKESGLISRFTKKDIYNPANIEEDLDLVRDLYRKAGYKDVLIAAPEIDVKARRPDAESIADQGRRLVVTVPIEEGDRWRLGEILIEGNEVFGEELLLRQFEQPRGGWLRSKVIDEGIEKIDKLYKSVGYIFSNVRPEIRERENEDNVADVVIRVFEQDQFRVGRLEFQGNTRTQDKVLRREMFIQEGAVMNMNGIQSSLLRIRQLNFFAVDEEEPVQFDFDAEDKKVHLTVQGEEAERTELQFGGGWSEIDGFFGQFAIRTTNFRGRGETMGISIQTGARRDLFDVEYQIPWFLDKPQNIGFRLFQQSLDTRVISGSNFESNFAGGSFTYGRSLRGFQSLSFTFSFSDQEQIQRLFVEPGTFGDEDEDGIISREFDFKIASIQPSWQFNTLDSRFEPTRGLLTRATLEVASSALGGDTDFVRPRGTLTYFKPITRRPFTTDPMNRI